MWFKCPKEGDKQRLLGCTGVKENPIQESLLEEVAFELREMESFLKVMKEKELSRLKK